MSEIKVGYDGEGQPVTAPVHHTVIAAITRAGKSVAIDALVNRSESNFLILDVKDPRDYSSFNADIPIYLEDRTDPLMLKRLLESTSRLWLRKEFPELIELCKEGDTYEGVLSRTEEKLNRKVHPVVRERLLVLRHLMQRLIGEMNKIKFQDSLKLTGKINVMNLSGVDRGLQQLIVDSVLKKVLTNHRDIVTIIDEAHRFIPQGKPSAARDAVTLLIREGGAKQNYVWLVDQTITGIDKDVLKQCWVWILGKQMEKNEAQRTLDQIPVETDLTRKDIMQMKVGHFLVCTSESVKLTYVQPSWLPDNVAREVALRHIVVNGLAMYELKKTEDDEDLMWKKKYADLEKQYLEVNEKFERAASILHEVEGVRDGLQEENTRLEAKLTQFKVTEEALTALRKILQVPIIQRFAVGTQAVNIQGEELTVNIQKPSQKTVEFKATTNQGKIMFIIVEERKGEPTGEMELEALAREHGWNLTHNSLAPELAKLVKQGVLVKENTKPLTYRLPRKVNAKVNVK